MPKVRVVESSKPGITVWEDSLTQVPPVGDYLRLTLDDGSVLNREVLRVDAPGSYSPLSDSYHVVVADE
jgi:hypothetical protein